jgi:hypothetical protein
MWDGSGCSSSLYVLLRCAAEESLYTLAERVVGKRCWLLGRLVHRLMAFFPLLYLLVSANQ